MLSWMPRVRLVQPLLYERGHVSAVDSPDWCALDSWAPGFIHMMIIRVREKEFEGGMGTVSVGSRI